MLLLFSALFQGWSPTVLAISTCSIPLSFSTHPSPSLSPSLLPPPDFSVLSTESHAILQFTSFFTSKLIPFTQRIRLLVQDCFPFWLLNAQNYLLGSLFPILSSEGLSFIELRVHDAFSFVSFLWCFSLVFNILQIFLLELSLKATFFYLYISLSF